MFKLPNERLTANLVYKLKSALYYSVHSLSNQTPFTYCQYTLTLRRILQEKLPNLSNRNIL